MKKATFEVAFFVGSAVERNPIGTKLGPTRKSIMRYQSRNLSLFQSEAAADRSSVMPENLDFRLLGRFRINRKNRAPIQSSYLPI